MLLARDGYEIDDDPDRLDVDVVHGFVTGSYWAEGVPRDVVARSVAHSLGLGLYHGGSQIGLTRAVTDRATFAWVCDVFVLPGHRGRGLGHWMIQTLRAHPAGRASTGVPLNGPVTVGKGIPANHETQVPCPRSPRWPTGSPPTNCAAAAA